MNLAFHLLFGVLVSGLTAIAAHADDAPKALAEANARNTTQGWSAVTIANGSPAALYRDATNAADIKQIAIGCGVNGKIIAVGGPEGFISIGNDLNHLNQTVSLIKATELSYGAGVLVSVIIGDPAPDESKIYLGKVSIHKSINDNNLETIASTCSKMFYKNITTTNDPIGFGYLIWDITDLQHNNIAFETDPKVDDGVALFDMNCKDGELSIITNTQPRNNKFQGKEKIDITIKTDTQIFLIPANINFDTGDTDLQNTTATIKRPKALLAAITVTKRLRIEQAGTNPLELPTAGLGALISRSLSSCR